MIPRYFLKSRNAILLILLFGTCVMVLWNQQAKPLSAYSLINIIYEQNTTMMTVCDKPRPQQLNLDLYYANYTLQELENDLLLDTFWPKMPVGCHGRKKVAILVPYRNRKNQLPVLLNHLHKVLRLQGLTYAIFVIEPHSSNTFNRAKLLNIGFLESLRFYSEWECFVFQDSDLLIENAANDYACSSNPKLLAALVKKSFWKTHHVKYSGYIGGLASVSKKTHLKVNGFSNDYWGWGLEDDDYSRRLRYKDGGNYKISRPSPEIGKATMLAHKDRGEKLNPVNYCRQSVSRRNFNNRGWTKDGLNSCKYTLLNETVTTLFIHFVVDLHEAESRQKLHDEKVCKWKKAKKRHLV